MTVVPAWCWLRQVWHLGIYRDKASLLPVEYCVDAYVRLRTVRAGDTY